MIKAKEFKKLLEYVAKATYYCGTILLMMFVFFNSMFGLFAFHGITTTDYSLVYMLFNYLFTGIIFILGGAISKLILSKPKN